MSILTHTVKFNKPVTFTDQTGIKFVNQSTGETASLVTTATISPSDTIVYSVTWVVDPVSEDVVIWDYDGTGNYGEESGLRRVLNFAGDSYIDILASIPTAGPYRIEATVKHTQLTAAVSYDFISGNPNNSLYARTRGTAADHRLQVGAVGALGSSSPAQLNTEYLFAIKNDGAGNATLERDGVLQVTVAVGATDTNRLYIGGDAGLLQGHVGVIKDVRVYDSDVGGTLLGFYPIDDDVGDGGTIVNNSGTANDGVLNLGVGSSWSDESTVVGMAAQTLELINCLTNPLLSRTFKTDQATYDAAAKGGAGGGGTTTVLPTAGPDGQPVWEYTMGAYTTVPTQRHVSVSGLNFIAQSSVGLWINITNANYQNLKKIFLFYSNDAGNVFTNYFRTTIELNDLQQDRGWLFIHRPRDQFIAENGADWSLPIQSLRVGVTAEDSNPGGEVVQIADPYHVLNTRPKVIFYCDDGNDTDLTVAKPYMEPYGFKGTSCIIESKVATPGFMTVSEIADLASGPAGWDIISHHETSLEGQSLAAQTAEISSSMAYVMSTLGYPTGQYFTLPEGKFDENTAQAATDAGSSALRTTIQYADNQGVKNDPFMLLARSTSVNTSTTVENLLAELDIAIENQSSFMTFTHGIFPAATGIHTDLAVFQGYIDGVKVRVDAGLCDFVSLDEYMQYISTIEL